MAFVYWIHLDEHADITSEGYVGITTMTVEKRFNRHLMAAKHYRKGRTQRIIHCMRKYEGRIKVTTLVDADIEYCKMIEQKLRPTEKIGWNLAVGGSATRVGCKNSDEHRAKISKALAGKKHSPGRVESNRKKGSVQMSFAYPWLHPYSNKDVWARSIEIYAWYVEHPKDGRRTVGKVLNMPPDSVLFPLKRVKEGWIPQKDAAWLAFKENYEKECYDCAKQDC